MKPRRNNWFLLVAALTLQALALSWVFKDSPLIAPFFRNLTLALIPLLLWTSGTVGVPIIFHFFWSHGPGVGYLPAMWFITIRWNDTGEAWGTKANGLPFWLGYQRCRVGDLHIQIFALGRLGLLINQVVSAETLPDEEKRAA